MNHPFVIPLIKIDVERRLVIGLAAEEIADKSKEIMDYASARPQFEEWSDSFKQASGGMSKGNLRSMHTKTVAGKFDDISYNDETKQIHVVAKVIDDNEWQKCLQGAYTGFSIGGGYLKKWVDPADPKLTRYTPIIREISLVDSPCMPSARFAELVKADGISEQIELHGATPVTFAEAWATRPATFAEVWDARPQTFAELVKAEFDESKHKRKSGKFSVMGRAADRENIVGAGLAAGAGVGGVAAVYAHKVADAARFGFGQKGTRNEAANYLRGSRLDRENAVKTAGIYRKGASGTTPIARRFAGSNHFGLSGVGERAKAAAAFTHGTTAARNSFLQMSSAVMSRPAKLSSLAIYAGLGLGGIGGALLAHQATK